MKFTPNVRYAVRILFALETAEKMQTISTLAAKTGMSLRAVENVLAVLKQQGITGAIAGSGGGIFLKKPLTEVSVGCLVDCFEGGVDFRACCGDLSDDCPGRASCETSMAFQDVSRRIGGLLDQVFLSDILHRS